MENSQQIEAILNSIQSIQKATAPPFFSSKVMHQLFAPADVLGWQRWLIFRPASIAATLGVFFLLNCWIIFSARTSAPQTTAATNTSLQQLAFELNVTSGYNLTDK
jgi:hypothetical protein